MSARNWKAQRFRLANEYLFKTGKRTHAEKFYGIIQFTVMLLDDLGVAGGVNQIE